MPALFETLRPADWSEVIGQTKAVATINRLRQCGGLGGRAYWITGPSGCGKSTIAALIAAEVADPLNWIEVSPGDATPARLDDIARKLKYRALGGKGWAIILNEAHSIRKEAIQKLLDMLEPVPAESCWLFTTTDAGQQKLFDGIDAKPLVGRCLPIALTADIEAFAQQALTVARERGLDGQPIEAYRALLKECGGSLREAYSRIEAGEMLTAEPFTLKPARMLVRK